MKVNQPLPEEAATFHNSAKFKQQQIWFLTYETCLFYCSKWPSTFFWFFFFFFAVPITITLIAEIHPSCRKSNSKCPTHFTEANKDAGTIQRGYHSLFCSIHFLKSKYAGMVDFILFLLPAFFSFLLGSFHVIITKELEERVPALNSL